MVEAIDAARAAGDTLGRHRGGHRPRRCGRTWQLRAMGPAARRPHRAGDVQHPVGEGRRAGRRACGPRPASARPCTTARRGRASAASTTSATARAASPAGSATARTCGRGCTSSPSPRCSRPCAASTCAPARRSTRTTSAATSAWCRPAPSSPRRCSPWCSPTPLLEKFGGDFGRRAGCATSRATAPPWTALR